VGDTSDPPPNPRNQDPLAATPEPLRGHRRARTLAWFIAGVLIIWLVVAYLVMPIAWKRFAAKHPSLEDVPDITHTSDGIPGDPLNVALVGTEEQVRRILKDAGWDPADPLSLRSRLEIADASVTDRPYADAPVSDLFLFGRKEDLAYEKPVGHSPRQRNHVRFWRRAEPAPDGRPFWVGSATFDERVGLSRTTGEITHHISPDLDAERDQLFKDLQGTGELDEVYSEVGFHEAHDGRNGGGDPWHTDGNLTVGVIKRDLSASSPPAPAGAK